MNSMIWSIFKVHSRKSAYTTDLCRHGQKGGVLEWSCIWSNVHRITVWMAGAVGAVWTAYWKFECVLTMHCQSSWKSFSFQPRDNTVRTCGHMKYTRSWIFRGYNYRASYDSGRLIKISPPYFVAFPSGICFFSRTVAARLTQRKELVVVGI